MLFTLGAACGGKDQDESSPAAPEQQVPTSLPAEKDAALPGPGQTVKLIIIATKGRSQTGKPDLPVDTPRAVRSVDTTLSWLKDRGVVLSRDSDTPHYFLDEARMKLVNSSGEAAAQIVGSALQQAGVLPEAQKAGKKVLIFILAPTRSLRTPGEDCSGYGTTREVGEVFLGEGTDDPGKRCFGDGSYGTGAVGPVELESAKVLLQLVRREDLLPQTGRP